MRWSFTPQGSSWPAPPGTGLSVSGRSPREFSLCLHSPWLQSEIADAAVPAAMLYAAARLQRPPLSQAASTKGSHGAELESTATLGPSSQKAYRACPCCRQAKCTVLRGHAGGVQCVRFSPDARRLLTASDDKTIKACPSFGLLQAAFRGSSAQCRGLSDRSPAAETPA